MTNEEIAKNITLKKKQFPAAVVEATHNVIMRGKDAVGFFHLLDEKNSNTLNGIREFYKDEIEINIESGNNSRDLYISVRR